VCVRRRRGRWDSSSAQIIESNKQGIRFSCVLFPFLGLLISPSAAESKLLIWLIPQPVPEGMEETGGL